MGNEHTGRKQLIGLGLEAVAGTPVTAGAWLAKMDAEFKPVSEKAVDEGAYGNIDKVYDQQTVKNTVELTLESMIRDNTFGYLLLAAFGTENLCLYGALTSIAVSEFIVGETVTGGSSGATGTVIRYERGATTTAKIYVKVLTGTFSASETITGGTSLATATMAHDVLVRAHVFSTLNTNNPKTFTLYKKDDVDVLRSAYGVLDKLSMDVVVGAFAKFNATFKGKKASSSTATPAFIAENPFLAKHATLKLGTSVGSALYTATATAVSAFKLNLSKNVIDYQAFGDTDVASLHNQDLEISGDLEALFNDITIRDYMINSTKKAMLLEVTNSDVTIGSAANPIFKFELARASFMDWGNKSGNGELVKQKSGVMGEFSVADGYTATAVLINNKITVYA